MPSAKHNFYDLLGVSRDASQGEIRRAYREAARKLHPDTRDEGGQTKLFLEVQEAYEVLSNPDERAKYDDDLGEEISLVPPVEMEILYSRSKLPSMDEPQLIYVLLEIKASQENLDAKASIPGINFCLVLDRSTSMQGARMDTVKAAAIELVRQLRPDDSLSIVVFSDRAEVLLPAGRRPENKIIEAQIRMIQPGGGTEIFQGLNAGFSELMRNIGKSFVNHMILLTDGRTYGDEEDCLRLAETAVERGVRITGLGIGTEWNDVFMDELSTLTGGSSIYVSKAGDIQHFLQEKFEDLNQIYAEQVAINMEFEPGVELGYAFRRQPDATVLPSDSLLRLGWVPRDTGLSVLFEIVVPAIKAESETFQIATGELNLVLSTDPDSLVRIPIMFDRPIGDVPEAELPPRPIFNALSQITLYRMQDRARQEVSEGKTEKASLRLQRLATQLLSLGQRDLAHTALMEADRIQHTHALSETGEKQMKYGTRALLLSARAGDEKL